MSIGGRLRKWWTGRREPGADQAVTPPVPELTPEEREARRREELEEFHDRRAERAAEADAAEPDKPSD